MTGPDDEMTAALARTLRHHAEEAPSADGLQEKAVVLAARRRKRRLNASIAAIVVLAAGIPAAVVATVGGGTPPAANQSDPAWRWESYLGVQVRVPHNWGYGVLGRAWCIAPPEGTPKPPPVREGAVGRPGATPAIMCESEYPPVNQRENWLVFGGDRLGERSFDGGWVEETRRVNGMYVTVFSDDDALRATVLDSAAAIDGADHYGCRSDHPVTANPDGYRPDPAGGGLPPAGSVESISVCRYALTPAGLPALLSSARLTGAAAQRVVADISAAPEGTGPDEAAPSTDASELVVLRIDSADGAREVVLRYAGGAGNGFDDGTTKHELTSAAIRPLLTGANSPDQLTLPVAKLLDD